MKKNIVLFALFIFAGLAVNAQRSTTIKDADYSFLKGETKLNVVFDYEGMTIGKNQTEVDYINEKVTEKNADKAGAGDKWLKAWEDAKLSVYEPTFLKPFAKKLGKVGIVATAGDDAPITLIVKTTRIEPGFYAGVTSAHAICDYEFYFVETANKDNIKAQMLLEKVNLMNGAKAPASVTDRVKMAYRTAGVKLSAQIAKQLK